MHNAFVRNTPVTKPQKLFFSVLLLLVVVAASGCNSRRSNTENSATTIPHPEEPGCRKCHFDVQPIMNLDSTMLHELADFDPNHVDGAYACSSCHGGTATASTLQLAHQGGLGYGMPEDFTAKPTGLETVWYACGTCHRDHVNRVFNGPMHQASTAVPKGHKEPRAGYYTGSKAYKQLMQSNAATMQPASRPDCQNACHIWSDAAVLPRSNTAALDAASKQQNHNGCSTCHVARLPQGTTTFFEHRLRASAKQKASVNNFMGLSHDSGVAEQACLQCHGGGFGLGERYQNDLHRKQGLLCQDCHTSIDIHGDGNKQHNQNGPEIECSDCHGTSTAYPWELPLGFADRFASSTTDPRGLAKRVISYQLHGQPAPRGDGYLLSSRGNPLAKVIKKDQKVWLYAANAVSHPVTLLKDQSNKILHNNAHMQQLECYTCHTSTAAKIGKNKDKLWAPMLKQTAPYADGTTLAAKAGPPHDAGDTSTLQCVQCHKK